MPGDAKGGCVSALLSLSRAIDAVNKAVFWLASFAMMAACVICAGNAFTRYLLSKSSNHWLEIQWYLFGGMFMLGAAYTLCQNGHVRVDLLYGAYSARTKLWIDLLGLLFFYFPAIIVLGWLTWSFFMEAWRTGEEATNAVGLLRWPAKILFPVGFFILGLQGLSELIKRSAALLGVIEIDLHYEKPVQ